MSRYVWLRRALPAVLLVSLITVFLTPVASAHERRAVGKYSLLVGFNDEPAFEAQPNGAQLTVTIPDEGGKPVEGLANSLKGTVAFGGGQPKEFPLRAVFGKPGQYVADFVPTRSGTYIFNFTGNIEGTPINERFESGPGRFNDVQSITAIQFPEAIPPANEVVRAQTALEDRAAAAEAAADSARSLATVGLGVGALGLIIAIVAIGLRFYVARNPAKVPSQAH